MHGLATFSWRTRGEEKEKEERTRKGLLFSSRAWDWVEKKSEARQAMFVQTALFCCENVFETFSSPPFWPKKWLPYFSPKLLLSVSVSISFLSVLCCLPAKNVTFLFILCVLMGAAALLAADTHTHTHTHFVFSAIIFCRRRRHSLSI